MKKAMKKPAKKAMKKVMKKGKPQATAKQISQKKGAKPKMSGY